MIIKYSPAFIEKFPQIYNIVSASFLPRIVYYLLHSDYRTSTKLVPWLEEQVNNPAESVKLFGSTIPNGLTHDETMLNILQAVATKIKYLGDSTHWKVEEYWATADETLTGTSVVNGITYGPMEGDCEDGAILIYVLARLKGIPTNRLLLFAGDVVGGGHCWCAYHPDSYPLNWVFMDWCYWPTFKDMENRNMYYINNNTIIGYSRFSGNIIGYDINYQDIWFGFNEEKSFYELDYSWRYRK